MSPTRRSGQPLCRKGAGPGGICDLQKIKKFLEAKKMVPPASIVRRWVPRDKRVSLDEPYIAVHLNLDCDWMLWGGGGRHLYRHYVQAHNARDTARMTHHFCSRPKHHHDPAKFALLNQEKGPARWAFGQLPAYVKAINEIRRRPGADQLPILIITAIGKPGHEATQWVVDELVKRLPANVVATQGAVAGAVGREVAAAAELGVLRHATHAVLVTGSTFSDVAMRWRKQSNKSVPVFVSS